MLLVGMDDTLKLVYTGESDKIDFDGPSQWVKVTDKGLKCRSFKPTVFTVGGLTGRMRARIATSDMGVADRIYDFCQSGIRDVEPLPMMAGEPMTVSDVIENLSLEAATMLMSIIISASEGDDDPCSAQDISITEDTKKKQ